MQTGKVSFRCEDCGRDNFDVCIHVPVRTKVIDGITSYFMTGPTYRQICEDCYYMNQVEDSPQLTLDLGEGL